MPENLVPRDLVYAQSGYWGKLDEDITIVGIAVHLAFPESPP